MKVVCMALSGLAVVFLFYLVVVIVYVATGHELVIWARMTIGWLLAMIAVVIADDVWERRQTKRARGARGKRPK